MTRADAENVKVDDLVKILPLWNQTTRDRKIATSTKVLSIRHARGCQTGILFTVETLNGHEIELDAGWFLL